MKCFVVGHRWSYSYEPQAPEGFKHPREMRECDDCGLVQVRERLGIGNSQSLMIVWSNVKNTKI